MSPPPKPARALIWRGKWYFFYRDSTGRQKRVLCEALGCTNERQRSRQVQVLRRKEKHAEAERLRLGPDLDYGHRLIDACATFLKHSNERRDLRDGSKREIGKSVGPFVKWLTDKHPRMTTGALDGPTLNAYFNQIDAAPATVNKHKRTLKAMVRWLDTVRPRLFPETRHLMHAFKQEHVEPRESIALEPDRLKVMYDALDEDQRRLFRFLAVTGCRLSEAHALTWDDVDLARGRIHFRITKTGRSRILPLANAPEGDVGPKLLKAMKKWKHPFGAYHRRDHWRNKGACNPQMLRQNWVSYAASIGIPASVAALWAGHSALVAEKHYRMQVLERAQAKSIESAMGF